MSIVTVCSRLFWMTNLAFLEAKQPVSPERESALTVRNPRLVAAIRHRIDKEK